MERLLEIANNQIILKSLKNVMEKHYKNAAEVKINKAKIIKLRSPIDSFYFSELKYLIDSINVKKILYKINIVF